jgi:hypothetical protein
MYNCGKISDFHDGDVEDLLNNALIKCEGKPAEIYKRVQ